MREALSKVVSGVTARLSRFSLAGRFHPMTTKTKTPSTKPVSLKVAAKAKKAVVAAPAKPAAKATAKPAPVATKPAKPAPAPKVAAFPEVVITVRDNKDSSRVIVGDPKEASSPIDFEDGSHEKWAKAFATDVQRAIVAGFKAASVKADCIVKFE